MTTTRRNLIQVAGGAAMGIFLTPAPWRLITDGALLSETWPGVPMPKHGEISYRFGNCSLCSAGCAVRARCVAGQPVSLTGVSGHPLSNGSLCAFGIAGHHLPYHPDRLKAGPAPEAAAAVRSALGKLGNAERCAVLDLRPGRTASWTYRRAMASIRNGVYLAPPSTLGQGVAVNLAAAKTVLSLGAPLMDGWGTPGNVFAARDHFRLIQAEPIESRTASMADVWLPIRPGSEEALALGLAEVLRGGSGETYSAQTGLSAPQIVAVVRELKDNGPALVLDHTGSPAAIALNNLLGAPGRTLVSRREAPVPDQWKQAAPVSDLASMADGSIRILLIDESTSGDYLPWNLIQPKLAPDNVVVTFSWSGKGYGRQARFSLPTAVYPEIAEDIPPAVDSPAAAFRLSAALVPPPDGMTNPAEFIAGLAGLAVKGALQERAAAIHKAGRGSVFVSSSATSTPMRGVKPDEFWKLLQAGASWIDEVDAHAAPPKLTAPVLSAATGASAFPLAVSLTEPRAAALVSPLLSKIYSESSLRLGPNGVALNPADAEAAGLETGSRARLETGAGSVAVAVTVDPSVLQGMVQVSGGPNLRNICGASSSARVVRS